MKALVAFFVLMLAGVGCWTFLPLLDARPTPDAAGEWSVAGTILVSAAIVLAFCMVPHRETRIIVLAVETDREHDGRWIAEAPSIPGALAYGATKEEAIRAVMRLAEAESRA